MTEQTATATMLALSAIKPGANPRRYFDQAKHRELVDSLRLRGMLQPILVRAHPENLDSFVIVAGGRRHRAAKEAFGADGVVPVRVLDLTEAEALEAAIDENDIRDDASETEQADAAVRILAACADDRAEAARRLGWSPSKLDRRLALAHLDEAVKTALDERRIKVGHAELLAAVPADKQARALDTIVSASLDVGKTRELLMRVTQSLAAATFDKTECLTCPFNSASQRALFETHVDDGHCTNPGCYQLKTETAQAGVDVHIRGDQLAESPGAAPRAVELAGGEGTKSPAAAAPAPAKAPVANATRSERVVTTQSLIERTKFLVIRESAWRAALIAAAEGDPEFGETFSTVLRGIWQVDEAFLSGLDKEELRFIAKEAGLIKHMGERKFAKLLEAKVPDIVAGMLNAPGFDWAGRLPSAMTIDGTYGAPPAAAPTEQKD